MRRPLVLTAVAFAAGIAAAAACSPAPLVALALAAAVAAAALPVLRMKSSPKAALLLIMVAVAASGAAWYSVRTPQANPDAQAHSSWEGIARLRGVVRSEPRIRAIPRLEREPKKLTDFVLAVRAVAGGGAWIPTRGRVRVRIGEAAGHVQYGDEIILSCLLRPYGGRRNPGGFDARRYFRHQGIVAGAWAPLPGNAVITGRRGGLPGARSVFAAKRAMRAFVSDRFSPGPAATIRCLILGERHALPAERLKDFRHTGTIHFLAVSGLHVGLLAAAVWFLLALPGVGRRTTAVIVILVVLCYALLGGMRPSILRAAVMCAAVCGGYIVDRRPDLLNSIGLAAIVVLLIDPADVLSAGFQLSFAAVIGIAVIGIRLRDRFFGDPTLEERLTVAEERGMVRYWLRRYVTDGLSISIAAWLVVAPLGACYFNLVTPLTPPINLLFAPLVWLALLAGLPAVVLGPILGGFVEPFVILAGWGASAMNHMAALLARIPGTHIYTARPHPVWVVVYFLILAAAVFRRALGVRRRYVVAAALAAANAFAWSTWQPADNRPLLTALDVGDGAATVLHLSNGATVLYDAGGGLGAPAGERVIAPCLWARGVRRIDAVIISHGEADHSSGIIDVIERFPVGTVLLPEGFDRTERGATLLAELRSRRVNVRTVSRGDVFHIGDASIAVLHPPPSPSPFDRATANDASLVVRLEDPAGCVLLTGDIEDKGITGLLRQRGELAADILLAPHHARRAARLDEFLAAVRPEVIVVSGASPPRDAAYARYRVLGTWESGAVAVSLPVRRRVCDTTDGPSLP